MAQRRQVDAWAEQVFDLIVLHRMTGHQLQLLTGLNKFQVQKAIRFIRDEIATDKAEPLCRDRRTNEYYFASTAEQAASESAARLLPAMTMVGTTISGTIVPALKKFGEKDLDIVRCKESAEELVRLFAYCRTKLQDVAERNDNGQPTLNGIG